MLSAAGCNGAGTAMPCCSARIAARRLGEPPRIASALPYRTLKPAAGCGVAVSAKAGAAIEVTASAAARRLSGRRTNALSMPPLVAGQGEDTAKEVG